jgi:hypothetical protein
MENVLIQCPRSFWNEGIVVMRLAMNPVDKNAVTYYNHNAVTI